MFVLAPRAGDESDDDFTTKRKVKAPSKSSPAKKSRTEPDSGLSHLFYPADSSSDESTVAATGGNQQVSDRMARLLTFGMLCFLVFLGT